MKTETILNKYKEQADHYDVSLDTLLLLAHGKAIKTRNYKRANKVRDAYKMAHKPLKLIRS